MYVKDLIQRIPSDTKDRVEEAKKRFNKAIRESIRSETRLGLQPIDEDKNINKSKRIGVPIKTDKIGYPEEIGYLDIPEEHKLSALLAPWQSVLEKLRDSSYQVDNFLNLSEDRYAVETREFVFDQIPSLHKLSSSLSKSHELAELLLRVIKEFDLLKHILKVNEDILGAYFYGGQNYYINLYWGVIGLVAMILGVDTEDLTGVVLAHELAHAYTHLGYDIDQYRWEDESYGRSEHDLKEGLAQYYTARIMEQKQSLIPSGLYAYEKLLEKQPPSYHAHLPWLKKSTPESVRATLLCYRKKSYVEIDDFNDYLFEITKDFRRIN